MAIDNVAVPVRFPALNEREIAGNGLFKDVVLTANWRTSLPSATGVP
jgi:hypothetical protein